MTVRRRWLIVAAVAIVVLLALIPFGRSERQRWLRTQNEGIQALLTSVRPQLEHPYAYRHSPTFACLLYSTHEEQFGKELCFDPSGHIVEAIRRIPGQDPEIWTVRPEPGAATSYVNPAVVARLLNRLGAQNSPDIQTGLPDRGPE